MNWKPTKGEEDFNENVDNYVIRNENHEMNSQKVNRLALIAIDDKRNCLSEIESLPWSWYHIGYFHFSNLNI